MRAERQQGRGGEMVTDLAKTQGASILCAGIFQQFRTGSELMSGNQRCRWDFKQAACKWSLAKIP